MDWCRPWILAFLSAFPHQRTFRIFCEPTHTLLAHYPQAVPARLAPPGLGTGTLVSNIHRTPGSAFLARRGLSGGLLLSRGSGCPARPPNIGIHCLEPGQPFERGGERVRIAGLVKL